MDPHPIPDSYSTSEPTTQPASLSFSHLCTGDRKLTVPILYNGTPILPNNFHLPMGGSGPPSNTWFSRPTQVLNPNSSLIGATVFAGLTRQTNRQTDHATRLVIIGRIYVRSTAMQPNNIILTWNHGLKKRIR